MTLCKTTQRAIVRQARREGLPVWAWMVARADDEYDQAKDDR